MLPRNLILVRHGESEGNVANGKSEQGDHSYFTPEFRDRHSSSFRLTDRGREQAKAAGKWLKGNGWGKFTHYFTSEYLRAAETAGYLGLSEAEWRIDFRLRERDHGLMDVAPFNERQGKFADYLHEHQVQRFYCPLPSGESMAQLCERLRAGIIDTLHRECAEGEVIIVSHGDVMRALRALLERTSGHVYHREDSNRQLFQKIHNAQIIHYTRVDPVNPDIILPHMGWVRSICPWDMERSSNEWRRIERRQYSNQDLLELAGAFPRIVNK